MCSTSKDLGSVSVCHHHIGPYNTLLIQENSSSYIQHHPVCKFCIHFQPVVVVVVSSNSRFLLEESRNVIYILGGWESYLISKIQPEKSKSDPQTPTGFFNPYVKGLLSMYCG